MILVAIIACEVAFWLAILGGLAARYVWGKPKLGAVLLAMVPVVDLFLIALVTVDLMGGATASWHHGLAAIYVGISVAYGRRMVAWADTKFRQRYADGPPPEQLYGWAYTIKCWGDVLLTLLAVGIAAGLLLGMIYLVGSPARTEALLGYFPILVIILGIDVIYSVSYTIWPRKPADSPSNETSH